MRLPLLLSLACLASPVWAESLEGTLSLTGYSNAEILAKIDTRIDRPVTLDLTLDASQSTAVQQMFTEVNYPGADPGFLSGEIYNTPLSITDKTQCEERVMAYFNENGPDPATDESCLGRVVVTFENTAERQDPTHGGTGIIQYRLSGDYIITREIGAGLTFYTFIPAN
ncbi:hypothetical protein [Celeribacter sp. SCSIO 80788]|uniref:hypothetical protein n=1 Tax=Celeribacter sp. SCSIO 80788 TaxID=3117013 RepID=UPI003DA278A4